MNQSPLVPLPALSATFQGCAFSQTGLVMLYRIIHDLVFTRHWIECEDDAPPSERPESTGEDQLIENRLLDYQRFLTEQLVFEDGAGNHRYGDTRQQSADRRIEALEEFTDWCWADALKRCQEMVSR